jgi:dTDP-glucose pyrophosphorylase/CBS domain-containing protein
MLQACNKQERWVKVMYDNKTIEDLCVSTAVSVRQAVEVMDRVRCGIVLVVDDQRRLAGTLTDGDMRRAILDNMDLGLPLTALLETKKGTRFEHPITAKVGESEAVYLAILHEHRLNALPLLDEGDCVAGLLTLGDLVTGDKPLMRAVVMAGGRGKRLDPLTETTPKPMLPVGERPLLERTIERLRDAGIHRVNITTHYKPEKITEYFGDGKTMGMELNYVRETRPLGTAGALGLMEAPEEPLLVINGDILTEVDFQAMLVYHLEHEAEMTVAVRQYDIQIPYGVVECEGTQITGLREKPVHNFFVNAGIYLLQPSVYDYIGNGEQLDMTHLIQRLLDNGQPVVSFPVREYWLDIGQVTDYERAQEDIREGRLSE